MNDNHSQKLKNLLNQFDVEKLTPAQIRAFNCALNKQDALILLPTGSGKSLCFQLPCFYQDALCLVVSPLIALMNDQVQNLKRKGFMAYCLHSSQADEVKNEIRLEMLENAKNKRAQILYISPERLVSLEFQSFLKKMPISLLVLDEAHCICEWGSDFRPEYQQLKNLRLDLQTQAPIMALTASAPPDTCLEIKSELSLKNPQVIRSSFLRTNLFFNVQKCFDREDKILRLEKIIQNHQKGKLIIYCGTRQATEELSQRFKESRQDMVYYHAGLSRSKRDEIQKQIEDSKANIIFCTSAFGMGIDYSDVRTLVHFQIPSSLEALYQEMGRAGRDRNFSEIFTLYTDLDVHIRFKQTQNARAFKKMKSLTEYLQRLSCRQIYMLNYFGDYESLMSKTCQMCDVCQQKSSSFSPHKAHGIKDVRLRKRVQSARLNKHL